MNPIQSSHSAAAPALAPSRTTSMMEDRASAAPVHGYGLPCAKCRTYYDASLPACPICRTSARVGANDVSVRTASPETKDLATLEEQRKRLSQELSYTAPLHIPAPATCGLEANHASGAEKAAVCMECYERMRERADLLEAALHIDLKEAAQVVYEAVWADPSDPTKTYQNAAQALLVELHKRAGISAVLAPIHPMSH